MLPHAAFLIGLGLTINVADTVPRYDVRSTCRAAVALAGGGPEGRNVESCVAGEDAARKDLEKQWAMHINPFDPEFFSADIWRTFETPAPIVARADETTAGPRRQLPTANGTVIRINHFPPESAAVRNMTGEQSAAVFAGLGNPRYATASGGARHPLMHRTQTIDYAIVLSGEITMVLDDLDVLLKQGDVVVQCGTNHAWSNRSSEPCVIAFILIDGKFDPGLRTALAHRAMRPPQC